MSMTPGPFVSPAVIPETADAVIQANIADANLAAAVADAGTPVIDLFLLTLTRDSYVKKAEELTMILGALSSMNDGLAALINALQ